MFSTAGKGQPCAYTDRHMEMSLGNKLWGGTAPHSFHWGGKSGLLRLFQREQGQGLRKGTEFSLGFSQNSSKMLSWTKSSTVSFTLAPVSGWASPAALGPAEPQRLLSPPCHRPPGLAAPPGSATRKGFPDRAGWVTKQSSAQGFSWPAAPSLHVPAEVKEWGCITLKTLQQGLHHQKTTLSTRKWKGASQRRDSK